MNNRYKFINSEKTEEEKGKLIFEDVRYIEDTLQRIVKTQNGFKCRLQIKAMFVDLDNCLSGYTIRYAPKKAEKKIKVLKQATEDLENKMKEEACQKK